MGRQGSLAYWLVHMLSFVTGRLDVEGGNLKSDGFYANARSGAGAVEQTYVDTEFGRLRRGALPGTLMADAILDSAEPVRAMIVVAGNPLLSIAGEERLRKAFEQLELLVVIDIYPSATAELADVVLPCTDMYERDDLNVVNIGTSARPFAQYTPAVVAPAHERRPEWWIAHRLLQELGQPVAARRRRPRSVGEVAAHAPARRRRRARRPAGHRRRRTSCRRRARRVLRPAGVDRRRQGRLLPAAVRRRVRSLRELFEAELRERDALRLIHGRDPWMHNTWFANVPADEAARPHVATRWRSTPPMPPRSGSPTAIGSSSPAPTARSTPTRPSTTS